MFTHKYRGMYIHGHCNKPQCTVTGFSIPAGKVFKSYRAAQLAIARAVKLHDSKMEQAVKDGLFMAGNF